VLKLMGLCFLASSFVVVVASSTAADGDFVRSWLR